MKGWKEVWKTESKTGRNNQDAVLNVFLDEMGRVRNSELIIKTHHEKRTAYTFLGLTPDQLLELKKALSQFNAWGEAI